MKKLHACPQCKQKIGTWVFVLVSTLTARYYECKKCKWKGGKW
jgi:hypothetical protein